MRGILLTLTFVILIALGAWYGLNPILSKSSPAHSNPQLASATVLNKTTPLVDFTFKATDGRSFSKQNLKGQWTLLFFGYGDCPDICPRTLSQLSDVYKILGDLKAHEPRFVFVSLDPKTDTIEKLRTFLGRFNPTFIGLTGNEAEMEKLAADCRIYSWTDPNPNPQGQKVIDHSATILLINPHAELYAVFSPPHQAADIAKDLQSLMSK